MSQVAAPVTRAGAAGCGPEARTAAALAAAAARIRSASRTGRPRGAFSPQSASDRRADPGGAGGTVRAGGADDQRYRAGARRQPRGRAVRAARRGTRPGTSSTRPGSLSDARLRPAGVRSTPGHPDRGGVLQRCRRAAMCTDATPAGHLHPSSPLLHDFEPSVTFDLDPVDSVTVTTLMDNVTDVFMPE